MFSARATLAGSPSISSELSTSCVLTLRSGFEQADVFVAGAEQAFNSADDGYACFHLSGYRDTSGYAWMVAHSRKSFVTARNHGDCRGTKRGDTGGPLVRAELPSI